LKDLHTRKV